MYSIPPERDQVPEEMLMKFRACRISTPPNDSCSIDKGQQLSESSAASSPALTPRRQTEK
jgi:hypothetical protein